MEEFEKEINTGKRVFWVRKHCILTEGGESGIPATQGSDPSKKLVNYQLNEFPIADIFNMCFKNRYNFSRGDRSLSAAAGCHGHFAPDDAKPG
jgi:hypothetical protein